MRSHLAGARRSVAGIFVVASIALGACSAAAEKSSVPAAPLSDVLERPARISARAEHSLMTAVTRAGHRLVAVGERGIVLYSDDSGATWTQAKVPVSVLLTAVQFIDQKDGWATGHGGVVLHSSDGGVTWVVQLNGGQAAQLVLEQVTGSGPGQTRPSERSMANAERLVAEGPDKPFLDVHFSDRNNGLVVGAYGLAFGTTDGGKTWRSLIDEFENASERHLYRILATDTSMFVVGEGGTVFRRTGEGFRKLDAPYNGTFFGAVAGAGKDVIVYGLRGNVYRLKKDGAEWEHLAIGTTSSITSGLKTADDKVLLADDSGHVHVVSDRADKVTSLAGFSGPSLTGMALAPDASIVLASVRGMHRIDPSSATGAK